MAELLGVVASGMSVVSLAFQMADSIQRLQAFCELIREAPEETRLALDEVEVLSLVLKDLDESMQTQQTLSPAIKKAMAKSLDLCRISCEALKTLTTQLHEGIAAKKKRVYIKAAMKEERVKLLKTRLDSTKSTMILANQCYYHAIQQQDWKIQQQEMADLKMSFMTFSQERSVALTTSIGDTNESQNINVEDITNKDTCRETYENKTFCEGKNVEPHGPSRTSNEITSNYSQFQRPWVESHWGLWEYRARHTKYIDSEASGIGRTTQETFIAIELPRWLLPRRYEFHLRKSYNGWDFRQRTYNLVPFDAAIFRACANNDLREIQRLFSTGFASPFDRDLHGATPLHYAAMFCRPDACRLILSHGADSGACSSIDSKHSGSIMFDPEDTMIYSGRTGISRTAAHMLADEGGLLLYNPNALRLISRSTWSSTAEGYDPTMYNETMRVLILDGRLDVLEEDGEGKDLVAACRGSTSTMEFLLKQRFNCFGNQRYLHKSSVNQLHQLSLSFWPNSLANFDLSLSQLSITPDLAACVSDGGITALSSVTCVWVRMCCENIYSSTYSKLDIISRMENAIRELILAGADIHHCGFDGFTPFLFVIYSCYHYFGSRLCSCPVRKWMQLLKEIGVDLIEYCRIELTIYRGIRLPARSYGRQMLKIQHNHRSKIQFYDLQPLPAFYTMSFGPYPSDLRIIWEDAWEWTIALKQFWEVVEKAGYNNSSDINSVSFDEKASEESITSSAYRNCLWKTYNSVDNSDKDDNIERNMPGSWLEIIEG